MRLTPKTSTELHNAEQLEAILSLLEAKHGSSPTAGSASWRVCPQCGSITTGTMHRSGIYIPGCEHDSKERRVYQLLKEIEEHCPCGARPESLNTHPHVGGCPVYEALQIMTLNDQAQRRPDQRRSIETESLNRHSLHAVVKRRTETMKTKDRKDKVEQVLKQARKISGDQNETRQAWCRIIRELEFLCEPEAKMPRFNTLLHALWIAATGDQT